MQCAAAAMLAALILSPVFAQQTKAKPVRKKAGPATKPRPVIPPQVTEQEQKQLADTASQSRANLISASQAYRESLQRVVELQKQDEARAAELVEKRKTLLDLGVIAKKEWLEAQDALAAVHDKVVGSEKKIEEVDLLIAEVNAAEQLAKMPQPVPGSFRSNGVLMRYVGSSHWALSDFGKVDAFFRLKFSRPIPVSALGQTETHNRLGFDHREAIDVAIHPDSAEGQSLIAYLQGQGISFIAIRSPIPGSATGAHIHIGPGSKRISPH
jgi:hypothetical protein